MRFYRYRRGMQIALTVLWCLMGGVCLDMFLAQAHRRYGVLGWLVVAAVQLSTIWLDYWTVEEGGLVQHGLFYRRWYSGQALRYAGPVRRSRFARLLKKSIEIDLAKRSYPRFVTVADRNGFLNAVRAIAPEAEIVG